MAIDTTEASLYGIGRGDAQVWGANKSIQGLQQAYQQEQLRKQKEDAKMQEEIAKINYDAARPQDLGGVMKRYDAIKDTYSKLRGNMNASERIKLQTNLNQQKADLTNFVALSKQAAGQLGDLGKLRLTHSDELSEDFVPSYSKLNSLSVEDPKFASSAEQLTANAIQKKFDKLGFEKKILDSSIENIPESAIKKQDLGGGNTAYYTEKGVRLNPTSLLKNLENGIKADKGAMRTVAKLYDGLDIDKAVQQYAKDLYESSRGRYDKLERTGASVVRPRAPRGSGSEGSGGSSPAEDLLVPYNFGKATVRLRGFVNAPLPTKSLAGSMEAIDMNTGKRENYNFNPTDDVKIVGPANVPFVINSTKPELNGSLAQPNFEDNNAVEYKPMMLVSVGSGNRKKELLIPYNRKPTNLSKKDEEAWSSFRPMSGVKGKAPAQPKQQPKPQGVKASASTLNFFKK